MTGEPIELTIDPALEGERLDVVLAGHAGSRSRAQGWIAAGLVSVDGEPAPKRHRVTAGQKVEIQPAIDATPPVELPLTGSLAVAYEDQDLIVVDKPAGLVVHPAPGHRTGTLVQMLEGTVSGGDEDWRAGLVHRLDRDTSGLLVLAKTAAAHASLKRQLEARTVERRYLALVDGRPPARTGTIDAPIGRDRRHRTRHSTDTQTPREARTHFELLEALPRHSLLEVRLETGRTHQIRVHLEAIGHPVAGDPVYGKAAELGLGRQFLHAARLSFVQPRTEQPIDLQSPLPGDLAAALERARSHS
jgi:23S rRNA pseudouridine1911/1915/1917 synthase